jgi:glutaredoxin
MVGVMKFFFGAMLCLMVIANSSIAASQREQRENYPDFSDMFITDVISILPPELHKLVVKKKKLLAADFKIISLANSKFAYSISKASFIEKYSKAPSENGLPSWMLSSMEEIFRIAFASNFPDPFNDRFRDNIRKFLYELSIQNSVIDYSGYNGGTSQEITEKIYDIKKLAGAGQKYSALVQLTANLWAAGWKNSGGHVTTVASSFERVHSRDITMAVNRAKLQKGNPVKSGKGTAPGKYRFDGAIELYVTNWCPVCKDAERYIVSKGYPYTKYDVEKDSEAKKSMERYPGRGVPLVVVGNESFRGFSDDTLESYMDGKHGYR